MFHREPERLDGVREGPALREYHARVGRDFEGTPGRVRIAFVALLGVLGVGAAGCGGGSG
jgi:hypothetical protein